MKGTPLTAVRTAVVVLLLTLTLQVTANADGLGLAKKVYFSQSDLPGSRSDLLPDIIVEWEDLTSAETAHHPTLGEIHGKLSTGRGGNHRMNGFFVHRGPRQGQGPTPTHISELGDLVEALVL